jgi:hypothetical protein
MVDFCGVRSERCHAQACPSGGRTGAARGIDLILPNEPEADLLEVDPRAKPRARRRLVTFQFAFRRARTVFTTDLARVISYFAD